MRALFYDSETTGLPLFSEPSEDPRQPHIVQLGACLVDLDTFEEIACLDVIVRPDGWTIPDDVAAIHGITTERALDVGVSESMAVGMCMELWEASDLRIGHNEQFDARILRIALMRHGTQPQVEADDWKAGKAECTQLLATPILKLPPTEKMRAAGRFHHKSANLGEAYRFFTGRALDGAHRAMVDVRACIEVYRAIKAGVREAVAA
jgi:DNA polymerase-3 subunit epsilon